MTTRRYQPQDYEFCLRLLNQGILLSSGKLGVMLAFSNIDELYNALKEFSETGRGVIARHLRKGHATHDKEHK